MAAAFFNALTDPRRAWAVSAGTQPGERVHPLVVDVMYEVGLNLRSARPQQLTPELARDATLLITMGCGDRCPYVPGLEVADWPLADPQDRAIEDVRVIRDDVYARVAALVDGRHWSRKGPAEV